MPGRIEEFKQNQTFQNEALKARSAINTYQKLHQLTQSPDFYSGPYATQVMKAKQLARNLGIDPDGVKDIESFKALSNDAIRQEIGSLGTGVSNADVLFLSQPNANLDFTPEGNRQLIETKIRIAQRKTEIAQFARDYLKRTGKKYLDEQFDDELAQWAEENPIFPEAAQSGQANILQFYASIFNQRSFGTLNEVTWRVVHSDLCAFVRREPVRTMWYDRLAQHTFSPDFLQEVEVCMHE